MFDLDTRTFCVIGDPIGHSLSPAIHTKVFEEIGQNFQYTKIWVQPEALPAFVDDVRRTGCPGFNATIPHKEAVMPLLDEIDPSAKRIGAVNTVHQKDGKLKGYNTDVPGLIEALGRSGRHSMKKVLLLGAGGAARAAVEAMGLMHVDELILFDLIQERPLNLFRDFQNQHAMRIVPIHDTRILSEHIPHADLIINATPVGMWPQTEGSPIAEPDLISSQATVFDMVYKPLKTRLMRDAESRGATVLSGLGMLIAQALAADEIWLDQKLPKGMFEKVWETVCNRQQAFHNPIEQESADCPIK